MAAAGAALAADAGLVLGAGLALELAVALAGAAAAALVLVVADFGLLRPVFGVETPAGFGLGSAVLLVVGLVDAGLADAGRAESLAEAGRGFFSAVDLGSLASFDSSFFTGAFVLRASI